MERALTLLALLLLTACADRRARDDAQAPEAGDTPADRLDREMEVTQSPQRAAEVGATELDEELRNARLAREEGRLPDAVRHWRRVGDLLERAETLGVPLTLPQGAVDERAEVFAALRTRRLDEARAAALEGDHDRARACWAVVLVLEPTVAEREEVARIGSDVLVSHAERMWAAGKAQEAWNAAALALEVIPEQERELRNRMLSIQQDAFDAASIRIALLPPWRTRRFARRLVDSNRFLLTLDNELHERFRDHDEAFITLADPAGIHDSWNRMQYDGNEATPLRAAGIAALYGGQIAVTLLLDGVSQGDSVDSDAKTVRRKDGGAERYRLRTTTLDMSVRCRLRLVDVATRLILLEREIESEAEITGYIAAWEGDLSELDLNRAEQEWFDPGQETRLHVQVRQACARKLADDLTTAVLSWLPRRRS